MKKHCEAIFSDLSKLLKLEIIKDVKLYDNDLKSNPQPPKNILLIKFNFLHITFHPDVDALHKLL